MTTFPNATIGVGNGYVHIDKSKKIEIEFTNIPSNRVPKNGIELWKIKVHSIRANGNLICTLVSVTLHDKLDHLDLLFPFNASDVWQVFVTDFSQKKKVSRKPIKRALEFDVDFNDIEFADGRIEFKYTPSFSLRSVDFQIENPLLIPEFNHIKKWIAKILGKQRFHVKAKIEETDYDVKSDASSEDIMEIDSHVIEQIKLHRIVQLPQLENTNQSETILDADQLLRLDEIGTSDVLSQSAKDILETMLKNNEIRNQGQIDYLSTELADKNSKLRFTTKPHFGFVFIFQRDNKHFLAWELLDSHATYLWSMKEWPSAKDEFIDRMKKSIQLVNSLGRQNYRQEYLDETADADLFFSVIKHPNGGLDQWKQKLNMEINRHSD